MSSNSFGTIIRIFFIALTIVGFWFLLLGLVYFIISLFIGVKFDLDVWIYLFIAFVVVKMLYPKNVFI